MVLQLLPLVLKRIDTVSIPPLSASLPRWARYTLYLLIFLVPGGSIPLALYWLWERHRTRAAPRTVLARAHPVSEPEWWRWLRLSSLQCGWSPLFNPAFIMLPGPRQLRR